MISLGFVLALWSGSRALNVFVDTITIMHGLGGHRGIVKTRALSFVLYVLAMVTGVVTRPAGGRRPVAGRRAGCPTGSTSSCASTGRSSCVVCICFLATLYHVSVPVRTNWSFNLPGATFSLVVWIVGSYLLRWVLTVDRRRLAVDLRAAGGADRRAAVALPGRDRRAHRRGGQRRLRHGLPPDGDHAAPAWSSGSHRLTRERARVRVPDRDGRRLDSPRARRREPTSPAATAARRTPGHGPVAVVGAGPPAARWRWRSSSAPCCWSTSTATATATPTTRPAQRRAWSTRSTTRPSR